MSQNFVPCIALVEFHGDAGYVKDALFKAVKNGAPTNNFRVHTYHGSMCWTRTQAVSCR